MERPENFVFDLQQIGGRPAMEHAEGKRANMWTVAPDNVRPIPGFNVRRSTDPGYPEHVETIAALIYANGWQDDRPMTGYSGVDEAGMPCIWLTDGYTRREGVDIARARGRDIPYVTINLLKQGVTPEEVTMGLWTSNSSRPLTPLGQAVVCERLKRGGMATSEIAHRLSIEPRYVSDLLVLVTAPEDIRQRVANGTLAATLAIKLIREDVDRASERIAAGEAIAKAAGKAKTTAKHIAAAEAPLIAAQDPPSIAPAAHSEPILPAPVAAVRDTRTADLLEGTSATRLEKSDPTPGPVARIAPAGPPTDSEILAWLAQFFACKAGATIERDGSRVFIIYANSNGNREILADAGTVAAAIDQAMTAVPHAALARGRG